MPFRRGLITVFLLCGFVASPVSAQHWRCLYFNARGECMIEQYVDPSNYNFYGNDNYIPTYSRSYLYNERRYSNRDDNDDDDDDLYDYRYFDEDDDDYSAIEDDDFYEDDDDFVDFVDDDFFDDNDDSDDDDD